MNPRFKYRTDIHYIDFESVTAADGKRVYSPPGGPVPSVTTILGTLPHPELDAWRERVGHEEADRITKEAATIGSFMHNSLEAYVAGTPVPIPSTDLEKDGAKLFNIMQMLGLNKLTEVWGIEKALYVEGLYAGRSDLIGVYNGIPSIIDYKNSIRYKKMDYVENYKLQTAAYAIAHEQMFGAGDLELRQIVILIALRPNPQFNIPPKIQKIILNKEEMNEYKVKWMDVIDGYYSAN